MSDWPKISVVVATRNRATYLKRMLDKLLEDDYPNMEIIVVDGASTDGTGQLLESYGSRITRWVSEPDEGEYFAYNKGLALATGEIVKLMTDDDLLRQGSLRIAADFFQKHPDVDIVFGQTVYWNEENGRTQFLRESCMTSPDRLTLRHWIRETHGVSSLAPFIRRRVFERIGFLATKYACGDMEFWARAAAQGVKMGLMPHVVADYFFTGFNNVIRKRLKVSADMVAINWRYGDASDLVHCLWRKFNPLCLLAYACDPLGVHPLRAWRRWKSHYAR